MTKSTHGILFDVGYGLLSEAARLEAALQWLSSALAEHNIDVPVETLDKLYTEACLAPRSGVGGLCVQTMLAAGVDHELAKSLRKRLPWDAVAMQPLPGMLEALTTLRDAKLRLGVLANQPVTAADDLKACGATELLDDVWLSDAVGIAKPDPAFFQIALDAWNLPAEHIAYLGDRPDNDITPANRLGLYTVRLALGPHAQQQTNAPDGQPNFVATNLAEAADHLLQWSQT